MFLFLPADIREFFTTFSVLFSQCGECHLDDAKNIPYLSFLGHFRFSTTARFWQIGDKQHGEFLPKVGKTLSEVEFGKVCHYKIYKLTPLYVAALPFLSKM